MAYTRLTNFGAACTPPIRRPNALTSPDRTLVYWPNLPHDATPVVLGWSFLALVVLPAPVSRWIYIVDQLCCRLMKLLAILCPLFVFF